MVLDYLLLFGVGLIGGFLAGLLGIGGGIVYVLVLPYLLLQMGFPESEIVQYTIANSLVGTMFAALSGNVVLIRQRQFPWKEVLIVGFWGALSAILWLEFFVNTSAYQIQQFNIAVIVLMFVIIISTVRQNFFRKKGSELPKEKKPSNPLLGLIGFGAGTVSAISGLGGGTVIIPMLNSGVKMSMKKAKAISLGVIFLTSLGLSVFNFFETPMIDFTNQSHGYIVLPLALIVSGGVVIGSPFGVKVAHKLSNRIISLIFVLFIAVVIVDKLWQLF